MVTSFSLMIMNYFFFLLLLIFTSEAYVVPSVRSQQEKCFPLQLSTSGTTTTSMNTSTSTSIGQAIQQAQSLHDLYSIQFWLPTDTNLAPHLRTQYIHHEKRQRYGAQWLTRWTELILSSNTTTTPTRTTNEIPYHYWQEECCIRAIAAVAIPFQMDKKNQSMTRKETIAIRQALVALHTLVMHFCITTTTTTTTTNIPIRIPNETLQNIQLLIQRAEQMANMIPLNEVIEVRWAARGLLRSGWFDPIPTLVQALPQLEQRVQNVPFDIVPQGLLWEDMPFPTLQRDIPFHFDTIVTRTGSKVLERRGTAWVTQDGIGALAYSGKLMKPNPLPFSVQTIMRQVEVVIGKPMHFFDCALCNLYPNGEAACKFHTDPEHGTVWDRYTCVIAAGDSRRFAFRPIQASWEDWDIPSMKDKQLSSSTTNNEPAVIRLFPGDIVQMYDTCNDYFHHAVYPDVSQKSRISLVLKRALVRGSNNKRGHGLVGEGRRSRRKR